MSATVLELTEEPYESEVAQRLVLAMADELDLRYADESATMTEEELAADREGYLAEVTTELTTRPRGVFLVAWIDGQPAGCGALKPLHGPAAPTAEIKRMYTAPEARRRGVGRALLERLEAVAAELGYARIQLETGTGQPEAVAMYESHGWHRIPPYGRYKHSPASICFAKDLRQGEQPAVVGARLQPPPTERH